MREHDGRAKPIRRWGLSDQLSRVHRVLLWLLAVQGGVLGVAFLAVPDRLLESMRITGPAEAHVLVRVVGAFVIATGGTALLALHSNSWTETRLFTWFAASAYSLIAAARVLEIVAGTAGSPSLAGAIEVVLAVGFATESLRRRMDAPPRMPGPLNS
jgi:hypothetical protein